MSTELTIYILKLLGPTQQHVGTKTKDNLQHDDHCDIEPKVLQYTIDTQADDHFFTGKRAFFRCTNSNRNIVATRYRASLILIDAIKNEKNRRYM
jgi:hypothetical protein